MQICDMRLKGTFGLMTVHTIMEDMHSSTDGLKCLVEGNGSENYIVRLILHCINS